MILKTSRFSRTKPDLLKGTSKNPPVLDIGAGESLEAKINI